MNKTLRIKELIKKGKFRDISEEKELILLIIDNPKQRERAISGAIQSNNFGLAFMLSAFPDKLKKEILALNG